MEKGALSTKATETTGYLHAKKKKPQKLNLKTDQRLSQKLTQNCKTPGRWTLLVVQWLRMHLPKNIQTNKKKKNASANPRYVGLIPDLGRFYMWRSNQACVPELLKPVCSEACLCWSTQTRASRQEKTPNEKPTHGNEEQPHSLQLEEACK